MLTIKKIGTAPCFMCGNTEDTAEAKMADKTFAGVLCKEHLWEVLKKKSQELEAKKREEKKREEEAKTDDKPKRQKKNDEEAQPQEP